MSNSTSSATSGKDSDETLFSSASASTSSSMTSVAGTYSMMRYMKQDVYDRPYYVGKLPPRTRTNTLFQYMDTIMVILQAACNTSSGYELLPEDKAIAMLHPSVNLLETDDIPQCSTLNVKHGLTRSAMTMYVGRDRVKMQRTAMFVSALVICVSSLQMEFITCPRSPPHGQKRKYHESPPENTRENPLGGPGHPPKFSKSNEDNATPRCTFALQDPNKTRNSIKPLGDIFYKFDPDKYRETCHDIGAKDTKTLFRKDGKHLTNVHVNQQYSLTEEGLWDLHFYDPRHDISLAAEVPTVEGELEPFLWRYKFVRQFVSFAPLRRWLNPYKGEPLLPEDFRETMYMCQLVEYRRCRRTPDCGKGESCLRNPLCHVLGSYRTPNANAESNVAASFAIGIVLGSLLAHTGNPREVVRPAPSPERPPAVNDAQDEQNPLNFLMNGDLGSFSMFPDSPDDLSQPLLPPLSGLFSPGIQDEQQRSLLVAIDEPFDMFQNLQPDLSQCSPPLNAGLTSEAIHHVRPPLAEDLPADLFTTSLGSGSTARTRQSDAQTLDNETEVDVVVHIEDDLDGRQTLGGDLDLRNEQGQKEINRYNASETFTGQLDFR